MLIRCFFVVIFVLLPLWVGQSAYTLQWHKNGIFATYFGSKYQNGLDILCAHQKEIDAEFGSDSSLRNVLLAVGFPELLRYAPIRNQAEQMAMEQVYARFGTRGIDLSTGYFQMKASFAEKLEKFAEESAYKNEFK